MDVQRAWSRLAAQVDLPQVARDLAPVLQAMGVADPVAFVQDVDDAMTTGELGYASVIASPSAPDG